MTPFENHISLPAIFDGKITKDLSGWEFLPAEAKELTFNQFEGFYPNKGGKLLSPYIKLDKKNGEDAYYRLSFSADTPKQAYEAVFFYDNDGKELPDNYDVLYTGGKSEYSRIVYATGRAAFVRILFQSEHGLDVENVKLQRATAEDAAEYCDKLYEKLPKLSFSAPADAMALLPRTSAALKSGKPWRVIMLGDSIQNDSFQSLFQSLVKRDFPKADISWDVSVRGSTGCWYYSRIDAFCEYVCDLKPDLLIIGGSSNYVDGQGEYPLTGTEAMAAVAKAAKKFCGCEVLFLTCALCCDTRPFDEKNPTAKLASRPWILAEDSLISSKVDFDGLSAAAKELGAPVWDLTTPSYCWLYGSGEHYEFYNRDTVHSGELGKQIIGRILRAHFQKAK